MINLYVKNVHLKPNVLFAKTNPSNPLNVKSKSVKLKDTYTEEEDVLKVQIKNTINRKILLILYFLLFLAKCLRN